MQTGKIKRTSTAIWRRIWNKRRKTVESCSSNCANLSAAWRRWKRRNTNWNRHEHQAAPAAPAPPPTARIESKRWNRNWPSRGINWLRPSGNWLICSRSWGRPTKILSRRPVQFSAKAEASKWVTWPYQLVAKFNSIFFRNCDERLLLKLFDF